MTPHLPTAYAGTLDLAEVELIIFIGFIFAVFLYLHREI